MEFLQDLKIGLFCPYASPAFPLKQMDLEASSHWLVSQDQNPSPFPQITSDSKPCVIWSA